MAEGDIADNWEDFDDSGALDKQLEQFPKITILKKPPSDPSLSSPAPIPMVEDSSRTSFQPQVKILKRQQQPAQNDPRQAKASVAKPSPSLAEREAKYAEARQRIFGNDKPQTQPQPQAQNQQNDRMQRMNQQMQGVRLSSSSSNHNNVTRQPRGPDGSQGFPRYQRSRRS